MKPIRFDPSGAMGGSHGVAPEQLASIYAVLEGLRNQCTAGTGALRDRGFFSLPHSQWLAYVQHREASDLGRCFKIANGQLDLLDAIVVIGKANAHRMTRFLFEANCDPFHNELRRGPRGGKPRLYFAGDDFNNDTTQALLSRLRAAGNGDNNVESRWGIVVISNVEDDLESRLAFEIFCATLDRQRARSRDHDTSPLIVPIVSVRCQWRDVIDRWGCAEIFEIPADVHDPWDGLSMIGLMPSAMVGLDVMKLLEGAVAMNEHFQNAPKRDNIVMQFAAINYWFSSRRNGPAAMITMDATTRSLRDCFAQWFKNDDSADGLPLDEKTVCPAIAHHLVVEHCRTDPLDAVPPDRFPDMMSAAIAKSTRSFHARKCPTTELILPTMDTFALGQLLQMLMIASVLQSELLRSS